MVELPIRWVASFVAVYEYGHFGRAARAVHLGQPAVSKHVAGLERVLGATLFDRHAGGGVEPTDAGHRFAASAVTLLASHDAARAAVRRDAPTRVVRLGVLAGVPFTARQLDYLRAATALRAPGWSLALRQVPFTAMLDHLLDRAVDVLWTGHAPAHPRLSAVRIGQLTRYGTIGLTHPLSGSGPLGAAEFVDLPMLYLPGVAEEWMAPFCLGDLRPMREANLVPIAADHAHGVVEAVARGTGVAVTTTPAVLPPAVARLVTTVELADVPPMDTHAAFRTADRREVVTNLIDALVELDLTAVFGRAS